MMILKIIMALNFHCSQKKNYKKIFGHDSPKIKFVMLYKQRKIPYYCFYFSLYFVVVG